MKKKLLLGLLLLALPLLTVQAQFLRVGVKAGGGVTNAKGNDVPSEHINTNANLHAGLLVHYDFVSSVALQLEMLYSKKGFTYDGYPVNQTEALSGDLRLNYLELPLMLQYRKGALFVEAGPYIGYLLSVGSDVNRIDQSTAGSTEPAVVGRQNYNRSNFNSFDAGYGAGLGLMMENGFIFSARHTGGLRSYTVTAPEQRNNVWQVSIGYMLSRRGIRY